MDSSPHAAFATTAESPTDSSHPTEAPRRERALDHPMLWLGALAALSLLGPYVPITSRASALAGVVLSTAVYVWLVVRLASSVGRVFNAPRARPMPQVLVWCVCAIGLWAESEFIAKPYLTEVFKSYGPNVPTWLGLVGLANYTVRPLALVAGATCGGVALSRLVKYPNMLGPLAGVAALIDIWGVLFGGIVSQLLTSPTTASTAQKMMAPLPTIGGGHGPAGPGGGSGGISVASIGTGDFLFLGLFFGVLWAHSMNARDSEKWTVPLVTAALLAISLGLIPFLPGLLFIGLGAAIPNLKYLRYTREENFALLYAGILVALLTGGLFVAITSRLEKAQPGRTPTRPIERRNS